MLHVGHCIEAIAANGPWIDDDYQLFQLILRRNRCLVVIPSTWLTCHMTVVFDNSDLFPSFILLFIIMTVLWLIEWRTFAFLKCGWFNPGPIGFDRIWWIVLIKCEQSYNEESGPNHTLLVLSNTDNYFMNKCDLWDEVSWALQSLTCLVGLL